MLGLYEMEKDATMVEINPMVETLDSLGKKRGMHVASMTSHVLGQVMGKR